jgi:hypothetical protein
MSGDLIKELKEETKELGIDNRAFGKMIALAEIYHLNNPHISEEEVAIIVRETINNYDYALKDSDLKDVSEEDKSSMEQVFRRRKTIEECFELALINLGYESRAERKF